MMSHVLRILGFWFLALLGGVALAVCLMIVGQKEVRMLTESGNRARHAQAELNGRFLCSLLAPLLKNTTNREQIQELESGTELYRFLINCYPNQASSIRTASKGLGIQSAQSTGLYDDWIFIIQEKDLGLPLMVTAQMRFVDFCYLLLEPTLNTTVKTSALLTCGVCAIMESGQTLHGYDTRFNLATIAPTTVTKSKKQGMECILFTLKRKLVIRTTPANNQ